MSEEVSASSETQSTSTHAVFNKGILIIFAMLMIFMLFEAFKHKHHLKFGHEASLVCVIGILISALNSN